MSKKTSIWVWAGLALSQLLVAGAAHGQRVSFRARQDFRLDAVPLPLAVGDFNRDGWLDLAVHLYGSDDVSILLGNGEGAFEVAGSYRAGTNPFSIAVGDFDGDGALDLAVANYGSDDVSVLLGNGDGTFRPAQNFRAGSSPTSVAVGD